MKQISFGAEGSIYETKDNTILKVREPQLFRHQELDLKLRKKRTKREVKVLKKLYDYGFFVPKVLSVDLETTQFEMEKVEGNVLVDVMSLDILKEVFSIIGHMHNVDIVHGDLTPLNIIISDDSRVHLIDFGLSDFSTNKEDKAVDLNVFFTFLENDFSEFYDSRDEFIDLYKKSFDNLTHAEEIIERFEEVELRGRNKNKN